MMRGHDPVELDDFRGLWRRGDVESTPPEYFSDCNNIKFQQSGFTTRPGFDQYVDQPNIVRVYNYIQPNQQGLLYLDDSGNIYHNLSPTPTVPILTIAGMIDFAFVAINGRAYISPSDGVTGLEDEFVYVYMGDGSTARKAAGNAPNSSMAVANGAAGHVEAGIHLFAVVYETTSGFRTSFDPQQAAQFNALGTVKAALSNIPVSGSSDVVARWILATKAVDPTLFTGNKEGYEYFFLARINDNITTTYDADFYDAELLDSADFLLDNFSEIPAGAVLATYHDRLVVAAIFGEYTQDALTNTIALISTAYISAKGEPESINQVDGIITAPLNSKPLTNAQEYRDVLYLFKQSQTYSYTDNDDTPATWPLIVIDQAVGASLHGISTVLDQGSVNVDYLICCDWGGVMLFNGAYTRPELSWVIQDYWFTIDHDEFNKIQILNDSLSKLIYIALPDGTMLIADYSEGMTHEKVKWSPWSASFPISTIILFQTNRLIVGSIGIEP